MQAPHLRAQIGARIASGRIEQWIVGGIWCCFVVAYGLICSSAMTSLSTPQRDGPDYARKSSLYLLDGRFILIFFFPFYLLFLAYPLTHILVNPNDSSRLVYPSALIFNSTHRRIVINAEKLLPPSYPRNFWTTLSLLFLQPLPSSWLGRSTCYRNSGLSYTPGWS